ncbi:sugar phosphate isomerase/epimerase family protein [Rhizorhabdus dicambivorans]|nr:TIM barrel protein [Rhizorhabdus dicambivorans]
MMARRVSLAPLSLPDLGPAAFVRAAGQAGYRHVALRLIGGDPVNPPVDMACLVRSLAELPELRRILDGEGLSVAELEVLLIAADTDIAASRPMLEMGAVLGARHLVVGIADPDSLRAADRLADAAALARDHGMVIELEFVPYTELKTIGAALALIEASGATDAAILVDALHLARSGGDAAAVAAVPRERLRCLQLCDATRAAPANLIKESRTHRLAPGAGELDLRGMLRAMPADAALSVEIPDIARLSAIGPVTYATELRQAVECLLETIEEEAA